MAAFQTSPAPARRPTPTARTHCCPRRTAARWPGRRCASTGQGGAVLPRLSRWVFAASLQPQFWGREIPPIPNRGERPEVDQPGFQRWAGRQSTPLVQCLPGHGRIAGQKWASRLPCLRGPTGEGGGALKWGPQVRAKSIPCLQVGRPCRKSRCYLTSFWRYHFICGHPDPAVLVPPPINPALGATDNSGDGHSERQGHQHWEREAQRGREGAKSLVKLLALLHCL